METLDIYILHHIGRDGISAAYIQDQIARNKSAKKINLYIDSEGGSVFEGYSIYNLLKNSGKQVDAHIIGFCGSISTMIALAADNIYMNEHGRFFIHNPSTQVEGDINAINAAGEELNRIKSELVELYYAKTGRDKGVISALMDEEKNFTASEAKEFGFITAIKEPSKAVAFVESKSNFINMDKKEFDASLTEKFNMFFAKVTDALKPVNEVEKVMLTTAEDVPFDIWVDAVEGEELTGRGVKKIVAGEVSEEPIEDGEYALADGSVLVVSEGVIASVGAPEEDESEAMKEIEELKNQLAEKEAALNSATEELAAFKAQAEKDAEENKATIEAMASQVEEIKNLTVGTKSGFFNKADEKVSVNKEDKFFKIN